VLNFVLLLQIEPRIYYLTISIMLSFKSYKSKYCIFLGFFPFDFKFRLKPVSILLKMVTGLMVTRLQYLVMRTVCFPP